MSQNLVTNLLLEVIGFEPKYLFQVQEGQQVAMRVAGVDGLDPKLLHLVTVETIHKQEYGPQEARPLVLMHHSSGVRLHYTATGYTPVWARIAIESN